MDDEVNLAEAAVLVGMSPTLLNWFTSYAPKKGNPRKLLVSSHQGGVPFFKRTELVDFDAWLAEPWPSKKGMRPAIPVGILDEIKREAANQCAFCHSNLDSCEAAHIEPVSQSKNNHPHNLIWLCSNHHTKFDKGTLGPKPENMAFVKSMKACLLGYSRIYYGFKAEAFKEVFYLLETCRNALQLIPQTSEELESKVALGEDIIKKLIGFATHTGSGGKNDAAFDKLRQIISSRRLSSAPSTVERLEVFTTIREDFRVAAGLEECPVCKGLAVKDGKICPCCFNKGIVDKETGNFFRQQIRQEHFNEISLKDPFFNTLKADYPEFEAWFKRKSEKADSFAYTFRKPTTRHLDGFLYLKMEDGPVTDVIPPLPQAARLKIGTFKVNPHGTRLGERFIKRAFDIALNNEVESLYVTIFAKHVALVELFSRYGFTQVARKPGGTVDEMVLERRLDKTKGDVVLDFPRIPFRPGRHFVLSILPAWHSRLLPDSLLQNESATILEDVSHTNSIHKIYLTGMSGVDQLQRGDTLLIYRTADNGPAYYTSVITSLCVVEDLIHLSTFKDVEEFIEYTTPYSIFSQSELREFYQQQKYPWLIKFTYNLALTKRPNRKTLLEQVNLSPNRYWGFFPITAAQLKSILKISGDYEKARTLVYSS
jgi:hypothetical protein